MQGLEAEKANMIQQPKSLSRVMSNKRTIRRDWMRYRYSVSSRSFSWFLLRGQPFRRDLLFGMVLRRTCRTLSVALEQSKVAGEKFKMNG
jgi:hypothetical protein